MYINTARLCYICFLKIITTESSVSLVHTDIQPTTAYVQHITDNGCSSFDKIAHHFLINIKAYSNYSIFIAYIGTGIQVMIVFSCVLIMLINLIKLLINHRRKAVFRHLESQGKSENYINSVY